MHWLALIAVLGGAVALRVAFVAVHLNNLEALWHDYARHGLTFRLAQLLDALTFVGYVACAGYALWALPTAAMARYGTVFVAWFGVALLERLAVHRFPRTNAPQLFDDARVSLFTNLLLSLLSGLAMAGVTALYFWTRG